LSGWLLIVVIVATTGALLHLRMQREKLD
jgi:hypothetical protein